MIDIQTLQDKHIYDLSDEEQNAIQAAYLRYFDTENVRNRAIGYCVLRGGVPTKRIGQIMINFRWLFIDQTGHTEADDPIDRIGYGLTFGPFPLIYDKTKEPGLHKALCDYIQSEPRLLNCLRGNIPVDGVSMPLFVALKKGRYDTDVGSYLATCHVLLHKAGKAIHFNGSKLKLYKLGHAFKWPESISWDDKQGFVFKEKPLQVFPFKSL